MDRVGQSVRLHRIPPYNTDLFGSRDDAKDLIIEKVHRSTITSETQTTPHAING